MTYTRTARPGRPPAAGRTPEPHHPPARPLAGGLAAGLLAGAAMAMFVMIAAATYIGKGFFSPMYMIAAPFAGTDELDRSLAAARAGDQFFFAAGPAILGAAIHMGWSMVWGVAFALLTRRLGLGWAIAGALGVAYALVVMVVMAEVALPVTEALFGGAPVVSEIPSRVGWATWVSGHAIFGLVLGLWSIRWQDRRRERQLAVR